MALRLTATRTVLHPLRLASTSRSFCSTTTTDLSLPALEPCPEADRLATLLLHHHNPFHPMESPIQLQGVALPPPLLRQTLLRLRHASKPALALFLHALSLSLRPDPQSFLLLLDILSKVRQFDVAWQLLLQLDCPSSAAFRILVRRLVSAGLTRQAVRAFDDMACFASAPDRDDFCFLLDTLCKYGHTKMAMELFNKRRSLFEPDSKMYTVLIYGWCKANRLSMAERLFREMSDRGVEANVVTYNVLLNGICRRASLHPEERFERTIRAAQKLLDEMQERGVEPDVMSYSIVLHVCSRAHKPELSLDQLRLMREKGICPTVATYTSVIKCLCSCGRLEDAEALLRDMENDGVSPSAMTYNCFFKEYRGRKDVESALQLYRKMKKESSCVPSIHTYNILLAMFAKLNRMEVVKEIWDDMKTSVVGPDLDSYTLLIHALCEKKKWREACEFFVEMIEKGFLPQKVTFETLYRGLIQSDMLRTWRRLKKRLEEESITFGSEFEQYHFKPYRR